MRSRFVVIAPPSLQHSARVRQRPEKRLVEQLVAKSAIEALDKAVLLRLAWCDVVPADAGRVGPAQDRVRGQFGAVVAYNGAGLSTQADHIIQLAGDTPARDRR